MRKNLRPVLGKTTLIKPKHSVPEQVFIPAVVSHMKIANVHVGTIAAEESLNFIITFEDQRKHDILRFYLGRFEQQVIINST